MFDCEDSLLGVVLPLVCRIERVVLTCAQFLLVLEVFDDPFDGVAAIGYEDVLDCVHGLDQSGFGLFAWLKNLRRIAIIIASTINRTCLTEIALRSLRCCESVQDLEDPICAVSSHAEVLGGEVERAAALACLHPPANVLWVILLVKEVIDELG